MVSNATRLTIELLTEDQLLDGDIASVEAAIAQARSAVSRIRGYEARATTALEILKGRERRSESGPGDGSDTNRTDTDTGDTDTEDAEDGIEDSEQGESEETEATPEPSEKEKLDTRRRAARLRDYPFVADALDRGLINIEQTDLLIASKLPVLIVAGLMQEVIASRSADATRRIVRRATEEHDKVDPALKLLRQQASRAMNWGKNDDGTYWFWLKTDPITGAKIASQLETRERGEYQTAKKKGRRRAERDTRTATQRRADAFTRMIFRDAVDGAGGAHLVIDVEGLMKILDPDQVAHTLGGDPIPAAEWDKLLNRRAEIFAWVLASDDLELTLGRSNRHADQVQKLALAIRDGGCVQDNCDRLPAACDAHHIREWENFGPSDVANLALLCPHHHQQLHNAGCYLQPGDRIGQWHMVQHHTHRVIKTWTNPRRRNKRKATDDAGASRASPVATGPPG
ncbi:MAG: HNH endonuclease [Actinomycetia bacterium]|nr:HNH endonuclease [Actinomycetes bacterium]